VGITNTINRTLLEVSDCRDSLSRGCGVSRHD
jgi:hypothetical protein